MLPPCFPTNITDLLDDQQAIDSDGQYITADRQYITADRQYTSDADDVQQYANTELDVCVHNWQLTSNGRYQSMCCQVARPIDVDKLAARAAVLLPLSSLASARSVCRIAAHDAFAVLWRAGRNGGCYGKRMDEAEARHAAWRSLLALANLQQYVCVERLADTQLAVEHGLWRQPAGPPPLACVPRLATLCRRLLADHDVVDFGSGVELPPPLRRQLVDCALALHTCHWYTFDSDWHDELYKHTCWRVGLLCLSADRKHLACIAAVDTD